MKIKGNTVGTTMPRANLAQTDPRKADFVKGKAAFIKEVANSITDLKILAIGNSFNQDAMGYLPPVLQEMMPDVKFTVATCYTGSASLQQHVEWFNTGTVYKAYNEWPAGATAWERHTGNNSKTLADVLARHEWDIITIQGTSGATVSDELIESDIIVPGRQLMRILQEFSQKPLSVMWFQWMGRATDEYTATEMFENISRATTKAMNKLGIQDYIPVGAAFHSALTVDSLAALGEGGGMLYSDNRHLNAGVPALLATYVTALKIAEWIGRPYAGIYSSKFVPDADTVAKLNVGDMMHGSPSGVTGENIRMVQEIAVNAVKHPDVIADWNSGAPAVRYEDALAYYGILPTGTNLGEIEILNSIYYLSSSNNYTGMPEGLTSGWVVTIGESFGKWLIVFGKANGSGIYTQRCIGGTWSGWNSYATNAQIGDLSLLETANKGSLVDAINEIKKTVWIPENTVPDPGVDGSPGIELDTTLTFEGKAADAKAVGDAIAQIELTPGPQGEKGEKGEKGDTGPQGPKGDAGAAGPKGDTGETGAAGKDGTSVTVTSVSESAADGGSNVVTFSNGKSLTVKNGTKGSKGDTGETGPEGPQGPKGDTGSDGAQGQQGDKGDKGDTGATGQRGTGLLPVTTAPTAYTTEVNGITPAYRIALSTVKTQASVTEVLAGDTLRHSYYHYPVVYVDASYVYCRTRVSIRGATGAAGAAGTDATVTADSIRNALGYTPSSFSGAYGDLTGKPEIPSVEGLSSIAYVDSSVSAEATARKKAIEDLEAKMNQQTLNFAEGSTMEEALAWLKANGDKDKLYIMPDNFFYHCVEKTTAGGTAPNFTNVLDTATLSLNKRFNSSDELKDANGIVALDYVSVKADDVIRFSKASVLNGAESGYQRIKYYNSSKGSVYSNDVQAHKALKITVDGNGVASFVVGYINTTSSNDATNAKLSNAASIAYARMNLYLGTSAITQANIDDLIMTINQPIEYVTTSGGTELVWESTGHSFIPTDYEDRIEALEEAVDNLEGGTNAVGLVRAAVYAPSPQLPADGSDKADFNAETITCKNIYDYIDALVTKYPKYITKETMGKDQSGEFDWNRYTCCRRYYEAWQKANYPKMYGWTNGTTTIYSRNVSPRIGDTLYTTAYIGTAKGTVSAVSNANQTRTVGGVVYTRNKEKDVEPTLVYSAMMTCKVGNSVYNSSKTKVTTISSIDSTTLVGADGITYMRYPLGDRNANFVKPKVIVIGSNEHGRPLDPAEPAIITARMIKDLCECVNANNPFLNTLKNEYMVVFLPIINPWGYDNAHKSYYNSRGVNLDRNLDTPGWGNDTSNPQGDYGGSEAEMQYFMNTLVESGAKIVTANHALGTQTNSSGEGANSGRCHYMLGRNNSKYDQDLLSIAETMLANYNLFFTDYGQAPPESYAKTRSYIDWIGAEGGAVEMQAREGYVLDGTSQLHTARILEADYTLLLQFLDMLLNN